MNYHYVYKNRKKSCNFIILKLKGDIRGKINKMTYLKERKIKYLWIHQKEKKGENLNAQTKNKEDVKKNKIYWHYKIRLKQMK